jgi:hypothetical protein
MATDQVLIELQIIQKGGKLAVVAKDTEKLARKVPKRDPALKKGAQNLREATKTQHNIITERRAPRKHKTGFKKQHKRKQPTTTTATIPLVILPMRVRPNSQKTKTSSMETLSFQPCSNKTEWVPSAKDYMHDHPLQMGGLPLSFTSKFFCISILELTLEIFHCVHRPLRTPLYLWLQYFQIEFPTTQSR